MSKSYKRKKEVEEITIETENLSKKEQYDLEKNNKLKQKEKETKKKKKVTKPKQTNLGARIFAIFMLLLMVSSVIVSTLAYVLG